MVASAAAPSQAEPSATLTEVRGIVRFADGAPAARAVIISEFGGQAVSANDGSFALKLEVPADTATIGVTAVASMGGATHLGRMRIDPASTDSSTTAGVIMLGAANGTPTCDELAWLPTFASSAPEFFGTIKALAVFDDGNGDGPALYAGGDWYLDGTSVRDLAKWNGSFWLPLPGPPLTEVRALAVFDDGSGDGPALYVGGAFDGAVGGKGPNIWRWDGTDWSVVGDGLNHHVNALTVFDDGSGSGAALYAGGEFTSADGFQTNHIARWNGATWSSLGDGMDDTVRALAVYDDGRGGGPAMYAAGDFLIAGGEPANRIARWDGREWTPLGSGLNGIARAMTVYDDAQGGGPALYAGGAFVVAGGTPANRIARWDGTEWSPVGSGTSGEVYALGVFAFPGYLPALYVGGEFVSAGGVQAKHVAAWNGVSWFHLGSGLNGAAWAFAMYEPDGWEHGPLLHMGGGFSSAGGALAKGIAAWARGWVVDEQGLDGNVHALEVFDDGLGGGPALYVAGGFSGVGQFPMSAIGKWDGAQWTTLGSGVAGGSPGGPWIGALEVFDDGSGGGPALYAGGSFTIAGGVPANGIAKWNGKAWSALDSGIEFSGTSSAPLVQSLTVFDDGTGDGPALIVGGSFDMAGGRPANSIARWNGKAWSALGDGLTGGAFPNPAPAVLALAATDSGFTGRPELYAGGQFQFADGVAAPYIARWDGVEWSALGAGTGGDVCALAFFDDGFGNGPSLFVGGRYFAGVRRWNGTEWSLAGLGVSWIASPTVQTLEVFDDGMGGGPALYAGGIFTSASGVPAQRLAKWNGREWSSVGDASIGGSDTGQVPTLYAILGIDEDESGHPALYVGGHFTTSTAGDAYLAKWGCADSDPPCAPADFDCNGVVDGTDLAVLLGAWGPCGSPPCAADLNGDGVIDGSDLAILLGAWG